MSQNSASPLEPFDLKTVIRKAAGGEQLTAYKQLSRLQGDDSEFAVFSARSLREVYEALDRPLYEWTGVVSGHNAKHVLAGIAVWSWARMLIRRDGSTRPLS